jgi:hypothetical protein
LGGIADLDALYRILRPLASLGIFTDVAPRAFAHPAASETLRSSASNSPRDLVHCRCRAGGPLPDGDFCRVAHQNLTTAILSSNDSP